MIGAAPALEASIGHDALAPPWRFMLDQLRVIFLRTIDDLPDDDPDIAALLASVRLKRFAPAAIQQNASRRHTGRRWHGLLADDPGKRLDA